MIDLEETETQTEDLGRDPDAWRDAIVCGDAPDPNPALATALREATTLRPAELAAHRRRRALRLWRRLAELYGDETPETLREVEDGQLEELCMQLERRIATAMGK